MLLGADWGSEGHSERPGVAAARKKKQCYPGPRLDFLRALLFCEEILIKAFEFDNAI